MRVSFPPLARSLLLFSTFHLSVPLLVRYGLHGVVFFISSGFYYYYFLSLSVSRSLSLVAACPSFQGRPGSGMLAEKLGRCASPFFSPSKKWASKRPARLFLDSGSLYCPVVAPDVRKNLSIDSCTSHSPAFAVVLHRSSNWEQGRSALNDRNGLKWLLHKLMLQKNSSSRLYANFICHWVRK